MEAIVPQLVPTQPQAHTVSSGQLDKGSSAGFQTALVKHMGSMSADNAPADPSTDAAAASLIAYLIGGAEVGVTAEDQPVLEDIVSLIDGLIDRLEHTAEDETRSTVEELASFQAMLDQLNALLALLGAPVIQQQQPQMAAQGGNPDIVNHAELPMLNMKSGLQDALLQLQHLLQQGTLKHVQQQEPTVLIGQQLKALTALLDGETDRTGKLAEKPAAGEFVAVPQKGTVQTEVSTLLQRLSQQTVHPAFASAALSAKGGEQAFPSEAALVQAEPVMIHQLTANQTDMMRGFAPMLAKAAPTAYVLADEFAQTMTGLIVQRFDVRTLNGLSEAKLMLFPEHLGQVDVRITMQNGLLTAVFQTDTAMAKDMLENQMAQLRLALQAQGLTIDKLEVSQGQSTAQLFQHQQGQGSNQQQFSNHQAFRNEDGIDDQAFESELVEQAAIQGLGYGRAINASV